MVNNGGDQAVVYGELRDVLNTELLPLMQRRDWRQGTRSEVTPVLAQRNVESPLLLPRFNDALLRERRGDFRAIFAR